MNLINTIKDMITMNYVMNQNIFAYLLEKPTKNISAIDTNLCIKTKKKVVPVRLMEMSRRIFCKHLWPFYLSSDLLSNQTMRGHRDLSLSAVNPACDIRPTSCNTSYRRSVKVSD